MALIYLMPNCILQAFGQRNDDFIKYLLFTRASQQRIH
jgi:hypothetical protein